MGAPMVRADACPSCQPGIPDAAPGLTAEVVNGGTLTLHECGSCGARWRTWWCAVGWPAARALEPVTDEQAEINRGIVLEALAEQRREGRYEAA